MTRGALEGGVGRLPQLSGRVDAERIGLVNPVRFLERLPDGTSIWTGGEGGLRPRGVRLDRVTVENGTIIWQDGRTGRDEQIDDVFAQFSAQSLSGPFQLAGSLSVRDRRFTVVMSAGRLSAGAMPLAVPIATGNET